MRCEEVAEMLPAYVRDGEVPLAFRRHLARCDRCKAELETYESLMVSLADLRVDTDEPPRDLLVALEAIPQAGRGAIVRRHVARNRAAYVGGTAALVAGAAGALVWRTRRPAPSS